MAEASFTPVIEPVKETLSGLTRALNAVVESNGNAILIVNPEHGDLAEDTQPITSLLQDSYLELPHISAGILLRPETTLDEALACYAAHSKHTPVFIHTGFADAKGLATALGPLSKKNWHLFVDDNSGVAKLSAKHFRGASRVLLRNGFKRRKNKEYPDVEPFSTLHAIYQEEGMEGFGDFLIVGDEYADGGGLPFVLAIHLTFIDPEQDDIMNIYHFKSRDYATQANPAGKFLEALAAMIETIDSEDSHVYETEAVQEFRSLFEKKHFPGLGYIKKLSMSHHIQTLARYRGLAE